MAAEPIKFKVISLFTLQTGLNTNKALIRLHNCKQYAFLRICSCFQTNSASLKRKSFSRAGTPRPLKSLIHDDLSNIFRNPQRISKRLMVQRELCVKRLARVPLPVFNGIVEMS